ncbi:LysR family transcriptional regulator [Geomonas nitrogeniifigens]|uniref:LysR family transcriptional regulator n=1 Tax=Geomonas diazotrophica TaxID=2843197 RepID=A0ABX8JMJ6_9BACT|nr:LysR family transcriptional regulator [Geomonas nitrogeniifigens]QWV99593.1 LysR family transcriptional regulator [Geomonas nitrogeniifigens]
MQTEYLKTLVVLGQVGSFSKAANDLSITQSAVSQRIKYLEDHYGCQLVDRSGKLLLLTDAGRLVVQRAEQILLLEAQLANDLKLRGEKTRLSICCTPTFGVGFLPQVMEKFMSRKADNVDLRFMFHSLDRAVKELQENEFDLAVIEHCEAMEVSGFDIVELPSDQLVFVSAPSLGLPPGEVDLERLFQFCLIARKPDCTSRRLLDLNLSRCGRTVEDFKAVVVVDDLRLALETVLAGGGISFVSRSIAARELDAGQLLEHVVPGFEQSRRRSVVVKSERRQDPAVVEFLDCIDAGFPLGGAC